MKLAPSASTFLLLTFGFVNGWAAAPLQAQTEKPATEGEKPAEITFDVFDLKETNVEGPDVARTYFPAGRKKIVFGKPPEWRMTPQGTSLTLLPDNAALDGEIHIRRSPFTPEMALIGEVLKYREAAAKDGPGEVENLQVQQPVMNPFPYNGWKSLGFTWTYSVGGRSMVRTVSYINLEIGSQIIVTTIAAQKDADKVYQTAKQFLSSWWVKG